jgi:hypothetical protein
MARLWHRSKAEPLRAGLLTLFSGYFRTENALRGVSQCSCLQEAHDLLLLRHTSGFLLRKDPVPIEENFKCAKAAHFDFRWNLQLTFNGFFQAPGLSFDIASHEAAFDFDGHIAAPLSSQRILNLRLK